MTSKQEKLAAARRKLKEFQGKNKETEISKQKIISGIVVSKNSKEYLHSSDTVTSKNLLVSQREDFKHNPLSTHPPHAVKSNTKPAREDTVNETEMSGLSTNGSGVAGLSFEYCSQTDHLTNFGPGQVCEMENSNCPNGLMVWTEPHSIQEKDKFKMTGFSNNTPSDNSSVTLEKNDANYKDSFPQPDTTAVKSVEIKEFLKNDFSTKSGLNDIIKPLQTELQNHAQTITILVQQRNDAQTALAEAQRLLNKKSEEAEELRQQVHNLTSSVKNLSQKLSDAENVIMKLKLERQESLQKQDELKLLADNFQTQFDAKEEEFQEMKRKYEEKSSGIQQLLHSLHEAQSQMSLYQIQLQQYSGEGQSGLAVQVSALQNENLSLKQKIVELEKKLIAESAEKEESSQKFHTYAQQCNAQLSSLNSQLKLVKVENEKLSQENKHLSENLLELENAKEKTFSAQSFEMEIANLHDQLSALSERNNALNKNLGEREEECTRLEKELNEKKSEFNKLFEEVKSLEEENEKLINEAEVPKANERLLAMMESDKVAAAKAVSQNQRLKEQVIELEQAFIKLNEEKLDLTNQVEHEKHVNKELQKLLKKDCERHNEDEHHHKECHHENGKQEPLVNDSNEIEELRNIVRQLQDDKIELTARLSAYELSKDSSQKESEEKREKNHVEEHHTEETQCENTKLLLQKMEEKVRKTMNEIAVLDEEKEKLEHLVLQLQGETETIGEYITLYQKQRMLLRQRAQEKDIQLLQLSKDKEELKSKLASLDELVQHLIVERENISVQPGSKLPAINASADFPENTAGKIRALINEIGSTRNTSDPAHWSKPSKKEPSNQPGFNFCKSCTHLYRNCFETDCVFKRCGVEIYV